MTLSGGTTISGDKNRLVIDPTFGDYATINFGDTLFSYSAILLQQEFYLLPGDKNPGVTAPSNAAPLLRMLQTARVIVLSAPAYWRQSYVAEYLADAVMPREGGKPIGRVYSLTSEASGSALLDALRDVTYKLDGSVILASSVMAEKYPAPLIDELGKQAAARGAYLILTTEQDRSRWENALQPERGAIYFNLLDAAPYTPADLTAWLANGAERLLLTEKLAETNEPLSPDTLVRDTGQTLAEVTRWLGSPGAIQRFLTELRDFNPSPLPTADPADNTDRTDAPKTIRELIERIKASERQSAERRIEAWFNGLTPSEQYLVLAISLLDGLRQETFWAIYEQLTQHAWRERNMALAMSDYHDIAIKLDQFVSATGDQVYFHNAEERRKLVSYALDGYRRSLVQALPVLADIVSGATQPVTNESGSLAGRLRILDIFGSELEPTGENRQRQERLRNSIANSIAQIAQREPATTQHLLLAWASGVGDRESNVINTRLRIAVTITLVQMLTMESPHTGDSLRWSGRHTAFALLDEWYERYYAGSSAPLFNQTQGITEERHRNIRGTMALALCHIGRHTAEKTFGALDEETAVRYDRVPEQQPRAKDLRSPWDMLLALAWDADAAVRASLIEGLPVLMQRHPLHAEKLIILLASDWRAAVRAEVAELLATLYNQNPQFIYLTNYLLDQSTPQVERTLPPTHYLRRELTGGQPGYLLNRWTALLALFYIADTSEAVFRTFLQTRMRSPQTDLRLVFEDVLAFVLDNSTLRDTFRDSALLHILMDTSVDNRPSEASLMLQDRIRDYVIHNAIQRNVGWLGSQTRAYLTGRYRRLPEPTPSELKRELGRVTVRDAGIQSLLEHYAGSPTLRVRQQIQRILSSSPVNQA